jgi:ABC-type transporter Mla maintaining outer membrane lipid asymmetry ATPase subunit MlaF
MYLMCKVENTFVLAIDDFGELYLYTGQNTILSNISSIVKPGEVMAIMGHSGNIYASVYLYKCG